MLSSKTLIISQVTLSAILGQPNVMQGVISDGLASRAAKLQWCRPITSAVFFHILNNCWMLKIVEGIYLPYCQPMFMSDLAGVILNQPQLFAKQLVL